VPVRDTLGEGALAKPTGIDDLQRLCGPHNRTKGTDPVNHEPGGQ
jgi:hypothetical protein